MTFCMVKKEIYGGETPYEATNLKMGIDDIEITDVYNYNDTVFIEGSSLTITVVF